MRLYFNKELLFKDVEESRISKYSERIAELCLAIDKESYLTQDIINQFKFKKMKGTDNIFKFYLSNTDASRCLVMYETKDSQIFESDKEPGLILLRVVPHHHQGEIARQFKLKDLEKFEQFIIQNDDDLEANTEEVIALHENLGKSYLKQTVIHSNNISTEGIVKLINQSTTKGIYKLSEKQARSLNSNGPTFLMGSAGSGKTLVEISKALKNAHNHITQAYFTYTPLLKETASSIYNEYRSTKGVVGVTEFHIMREYFLTTLNIPESKYFGFEQFLNWYKQKKKNPNKNYKLIWQTDPIDLWTEIRGILKGFVGFDSYRISEFTNNGHLQQHEVDFLLNQGLISKKVHSKNSYFIQKGDELKVYIQLNAKVKLQNTLIEQDLNNPILDENSYVELMKAHYSHFNKQDRAIIHTFVKTEYSTHLANNGYFDDNDLARAMLRMLKLNKEFKRFDRILIDEVQDLTEWQIKTLISLCEDPNGLFLAGDVAQVINPTFFHQGRLGIIFKNHFQTDLRDIYTLDENYRNSENIINVLDALLQIRRKKIGTYSYDIQEVATSLEKSEGLPFLLNIPLEEMITVIDNWIDVPGVAIIVPSSEVRNEILHKTDRKASKTINLFTVQEIKGQEFDKIIAFNMMSFYRESWKIIEEQKIQKGSDEALQFRFYFNTLYVAITRGRKNLYLYEDEKNLSVLQQLKPYFEEVTENAFEITDVKSYDTEENRILQAEAFFKNQEFKRASQMYYRANNKRMALYALGFHLLETNPIDKWEEAIVMLYTSRDYEEKIFKKTNDPKLWFFRSLIGYRNKYLTIEECSKLFKGHDVFEKLKQLVSIKNYNNRITLDTLNLISKIHQKNIKLKIERIKE